MVMAFVLFLGINLLPDLRRRPVFRLKILADGRVLLIRHPDFLKAVNNLTF